MFRKQDHGGKAVTHAGRDPLEKTSWRLVEGVPLPPNTTITARFAGGMMSGSAGTNRYRAEYERRGNAMRLGPAGTTRAVGKAGSTKAESDFLTLLGGVRRYSVAGSDLRLEDESGRSLLRFEAGPDVSEDLAGRWDVRAVRRGHALERPTAGREPYLAFDAKGRVSGSGGINRFEGPARTNGDRLTLGPLGATRMAGPPEAMDDEAAFLGTLDDVAAYRLDGDSLVLLDQDGETMAELARSRSKRRGA